MPTPVRIREVGHQKFDSTRAIKYGDTGLPLFPAIWRLYLGDIELPVNSTFCGSRIKARELDSTVTRRYNFDDLPSTRTTVIRWIKAAGSGLDALPVIPWTIRERAQLKGLNLTAKAQALLDELITFWEEVSRSPTYGEFRKMENWTEANGIFCLCLLESIGESSLKGDPGELAFLKGIRQNRTLLAIPLRDDRFRSSKLDGFSTSMLTYQDLMNELVQGRLGKDIRIYLYEAEAKFSECVLEPNLMEELHALCRATKILRDPDRQDFFLRRIGAENGNPKTLQEVGDQYSLTRERVRQILDKAVEQMNGSSPMLTPAIDKAMGLLVANSPCNYEEAISIFRHHGIDDFGVHANAIIEVYEFLGRKSYLVYSKEWGGMFIPAGMDAQTKIILGKIDSIMCKYCGISPQLASQCLGGVKQIRAALCTERVLSRLLATHPRYINVGGEDTPWYIPSNPDKRRGLFRVLQRIAHVGNEISLSEVRDGFKRSSKHRGHLYLSTASIPDEHVGRLHNFIPDKALMNVILLTDGVDNIGSDRVDVSRYRDDSIQLPAMEKMTLDLLDSTPDGLALRWEIMDYCVARGADKTIIELSAISTNVLLKRISRCVYAVVGRHVNETALLAAKERVSLIEKMSRRERGIQLN